jgi:large subunit ribosomal protein L4e
MARGHQVATVPEVPLVIESSAFTAAAKTAAAIGLLKGFRNIPGVETSPVDALNLLQLAPGGHLGRFIVWTSAAIKELDAVYESKKGFFLPSNVVAQADLSRLINSSEIQSVLKAPKGEARTKRGAVQKKNPLRNKQVLLRQNPYAATFAKQGLGSQKAEGKGKPLPEAFKKLLNE